MAEKRRLTAQKAAIAEIIRGKFVHMTGFESSYVQTAGGKRLTRVRVLGLIVDRFTSPDQKYATVTIDDGGETIRCKSFVNIKIFDGLTPGDLIEVFGKLREYGAEVYVTPELVRKVDANFETLRLLEFARANKAIQTVPAAAPEPKEKILQLIAAAGPEGADYQELVGQSGLPEAAVDSAIHDLLGAGVCGEPRPGRIRKL